MIYQVTIYHLIYHLTIYHVTIYHLISSHFFYLSPQEQKRRKVWDWYGLKRKKREMRSIFYHHLIHLPYLSHNLPSHHLISPLISHWSWDSQDTLQIFKNMRWDEMRWDGRSWERENQPSHISQSTISSHLPSHNLPSHLPSLIKTSTLHLPKYKTRPPEKTKMRW